MPRKLTSPLESVEFRLKLEPRRKPYNPTSVAPGARLAIRRNVRNACTWVALLADGKGGERQVKIADADDYERANGRDVLNFWQATEAARKLVRGPDPGDRPTTLDAMFDGAYRNDLIARGKRLANIRNARKHLPLALAQKPIVLVTAPELHVFKQSLLTKSKLKQTSVRRLLKPILAAVAFAERLDHRITNGKIWREALGGIEDNYESRNVDVISDADVHRFIGAAYEVVGPEFGLFIEVLAHTGTRPSQAARLLVSDLVNDPKAPRLHMPVSRKGRGQRKVSHQPVAISSELARKLKAAAKGKPASALLLPKASGQAWSLTDHTVPTRKVCEATGLDITVYVLRHCSIVRALLANVPIRIVAASHDTSVAQIERTYSKHILHFSDTVARQGLLAPAPASNSNVVPLR